MGAIGADGRRWVPGPGSTSSPSLSSLTWFPRLSPGSSLGSLNSGPSSPTRGKREKRPTNNAFFDDHAIVAFPCIDYFFGEGIVKAIAYGVACLENFQSVTVGTAVFANAPVTRELVRACKQFSWTRVSEQDGARRQKCRSEEVTPRNRGVQAKSRVRCAGFWRHLGTIDGLAVTAGRVRVRSLSWLSAQSVDEQETTQLLLVGYHPISQPIEPLGLR